MIRAGAEDLNAGKNSLRSRVEDLGVKGVSLYSAGNFRCIMKPLAHLTCPRGISIILLQPPCRRWVSLRMQILLERYSPGIIHAPNVERHSLCMNACPFSIPFLF